MAAVSSNLCAFQLRLMLLDCPECLQAGGLHCRRSRQTWLTWASRCKQLCGGEGARPADAVIGACRASMAFRGTNPPEDKSHQLEEGTAVLFSKIEQVRRKGKRRYAWRIRARAFSHAEPRQSHVLTCLRTILSDSSGGLAPTPSSKPAAPAVAPTQHFYSAEATTSWLIASNPQPCKCPTQSCTVAKAAQTGIITCCW
jgi:hypothetical protein